MIFGSPYLGSLINGSHTTENGLLGSIPRILVNSYVVYLMPVINDIPPFCHVR